MVKFWRFLRNALIGLVVLLVGGWLLLFREVPQPATNDPEFVFNHGSIGNELTQGLPYWIWRVMPVVFSDHLPGNKRGWAAIGVDWRPGDHLPQGFSQKTLGVIPRVSPNCGFCHQGTYRLNKTDPGTVVIGSPGHRMDVQGFVRFIMAAAQDDRFNSGTIMAEINRIYDMPLWEKAMYRFVLIPATRMALKQQVTDMSWINTRPDWGLGRVDPFNPPKYTFLGLQDDGTIGNSDMMSVWNLKTATNPDYNRRFSVHWDGLQTSLDQTMVMGAIGDGLTYPQYEQAKAHFDIVTDFIDHAMPPDSPFHGRHDPSDPLYVAQDEVEKGRDLYTTYCADCHEPGGNRFRMAIDITELDTDRHRLDMWSQEARDTYAVYQEDKWGGFDEFRKTNGYLAVDLTGLWMRSPYLHNGSVPNLRALLQKPEDRPTEFYRGSDLVDAENGGFVSGADDDPYRRVWKHDTSVAGNANSGHVWGTDLPDADKEALLAYLKTR